MYVSAKNQFGRVSSERGREYINTVRIGFLIIKIKLYRHIVLLAAAIKRICFVLETKYTHVYCSMHCYYYY